MEPFLVNPHLGIINPRKRKRKAKGNKSMARRSSKAHMAYVRSFKKTARKKASPRRRARRRKSSLRNPYPVAGLALNPRRRKHSKRRRSHAVAHRTRRRSSYSRNPRILGFEFPPINKVIFAGVGFIAPPALEGLISGYLPASILSSTLGKYAVRIAAVLGLTYGIKRFVGREEGNMTLIGGGVYVLSTAALEFAPDIFGKIIPANAIPKQVKGYVPAARQLQAYVGANQSVNNTLGMPSFMSDNIEDSGAYGGTASRFKRG
jgi:hypothetical protein